MAKRKYKKIIKQKPDVYSKIGYKTIKGIKKKYVFVAIKKGNKHIVKGYKYHGGKKATYEHEAKLPEGTKYIIDYRKNQIIKDPQYIERLIKNVKDRKKQRKTIKSAKKKKIISRKVKLPKIPTIIVKKTRHPPKPIEAKKIVDVLSGKIFYERTHNLQEFSNKTQENKFFIDLLRKGTTNIKDAKALVQNFDKIKAKLSYVVNINGQNEKGERTTIGYFTTIGLKPTEIKNILEKAKLLPNNEYIDINSEKRENYKQILAQNGIYPNQQQLNTGKYAITDIELVVKFVNNPLQSYF